MVYGSGKKAIFAKIHNKPIANEWVSMEIINIIKTWVNLDYDDALQILYQLRNLFFRPEIAWKI